MLALIFTFNTRLYADLLFILFCLLSRQGIEKQHDRLNSLVVIINSNFWAIVKMWNESILYIMLNVLNFLKHLISILNKL